MTIFLWIIAVFHGALLVNALANFFYFQRNQTPTGPTKLPRVSVLVPARNEAENLPRLLHSFDMQNHPDAELIVYDDLSEDTTWYILEQHDNPNVRALPGLPLPEGWVGKVHGCYQLSLAATGGTFLFIDADTEFRTPDALRNMCLRFESRPTGTMLTGMTMLLGKGRLIVTMVGNLILACIPWWLGNRVPFAGMTGVNGQCWMISNDEYRRFEPHRQVRGEVLEDVKIGRYLHRNGIRPILDNVQRDLAVHMYPSFRSAWKGFQKNTATILGDSALVSLVSLTAYAVVFIWAPLQHIGFLASLFAIKAITDRTTGQPWTLTVLAPISYLLTIFIGLDSIITRSRGKIEWKGRKIR